MLTCHRFRCFFDEYKFLQLLNFNFYHGKYYRYRPQKQKQKLNNDRSGKGDLKPKSIISRWPAPGTPAPQACPAKPLLGQGTPTYLQ